MTTTKIGSGRPLFSLPNGRFDQITTKPLPPIKPVTETTDERARITKAG